MEDAHKKGVFFSGRTIKKNHLSVKKNDQNLINH